jgi:phosphate-selective porin OprO/OprP
VFTERPFIVEAFNEDARRLGISSNGVSKDQAWNWRYGLWNQDLTQTSAGWRGDHYQSEVAGRIANTAWYDESSGGRGYFHWALSGSYGQADGGSPDNVNRYRTRPESRTTSRWLDTGFIDGSEENSLFGVETVFNVGAFQMTAEYLQTFVNRDTAVGNDLNFGGGYIQAAYFLTGEHTPWVRKTGTLGRVKPLENFFAVRDCDGQRGFGLGAWQIAARYSYADLQDEDIIGGKGESFTLGVNWWWNPNARVQANYIVGEVERSPLADNAQYQIFGIRWMVDF